MDPVYSAARKNAVRASALKNKSSALRGPSAMGARWLFLLTFYFFFFYPILTPTERSSNAVENLDSPLFSTQIFGNFHFKI